jgi:FkbM family methyltransferase
MSALLHCVIPAALLSNWVDFGEMPACMKEAATTVQAPGGSCVLANISTGSYYAWHPGDTPLQLADNVSAPLPTPMVVLQGIGPSTGRYVQDQVSLALVTGGTWELTADLLDSFKLAPGSNVVDIGAHVGSFAFGLARAHMHVIAVEPFLHNLAALHATRCLHPELASRVEVVPHAVGSEAQQGPCQLISSRNNLGDGRVVCVNASKLTNASLKTAIDRHTNAYKEYNAGYMFHHRVFHQGLAAPLPGLAPMLTLDALLVDGKALTHPAGSVDLLKIDTGNECDVLEGGARALFHKLRPRILLINVDAPASYACVRAAAERHAFDVLEMTIGPPTRPPNSGKHLLLTDRHRAARAEGRASSA